MGHFMNEDVIGRVIDNVFYDSFKEVATMYPQNGIDLEVWEDAATIALYNTPAHVGLFNKSDIIIIYDWDTYKPAIISERIYRKNYSFWDWQRCKKLLSRKAEVVHHELGKCYMMSISYSYIESIHYDEAYMRRMPQLTATLLTNLKGERWREKSK